MEENQTPAQSEVPAQAAPEVAQPQVNEGIQKRIDQLTARIHEKDSQVQELTNKLLELATRQQTPAAQPLPAAPEVDPLAEYGEQLDPVVAKAVKAAVGSISKKFETTLAQQQEFFAREMNAMQVQAVAGQYGDVVPQEVRAKAASIAKQYGTAPDIALKVAFGEHALEQAKKVRNVAGYVPPSTPIMTGAAPAPQTRQGPQRPANFDSLSPSQQIQWFETHGFDDPSL
jgi:hypothetical protein